MTVSYSGDVANASRFGIFIKILLRWRGSVYKLVFKELIAYSAMYMVVNIMYRLILVANSDDCDEALPSCIRWKKYRVVFETLRLYVNNNIRTIPLTFVLGFYVSLVLNRWWKQYKTLPWPDSFAIMLVGVFVVDNDDKGRILRRTMIRYVTLAYCIALRTVSFRLKKRFPTIEHLVHAGLMRQDEYEEFQRLDEKVVANKWFLPLVWCAKIIGEGVENGNLNAPSGSTVMNEVGKIRQGLTTILTYDWISIPLVYTQVVTLAVYFYFAGALFGSQWVAPTRDEDFAKMPAEKQTGRIDLFYPFFLTLQFAFFVGWLKVAETLINPFGEDDDDFELNRLLDRHLHVGFLIVDPSKEKPELLKDSYWDEQIPAEIPYTLASVKDRNTEFQGSAEITLNYDLRMYLTDKFYQDVGGPTQLRRRAKSRETIYESVRNLRFPKSRRLSQISHLFARKKRPQRFQRFRSRKNFMTAQPEHFPSAVLGQVDPRRRDSLDPTLLLVDPRRRDSLDPTLLLVDPRRRDSLDPTLLLADMEFLENYNIV
ncbi:bestrophin-4 isoform X3 [Eurytemora carolleeae]|uniref:bestrophin-4 isoform X3 n=1 Tax=Eurytemora carolleeae TaxID=1294199 RepID=UPI000C768C4D|nr:bestrophin-4 isoform X3 [Eurytemora carolleeae]|eukprot:XP_023341648.1 bestrophin-4-like isoform X3 [Eurytemora affinis]